MLYDKCVSHIDVPQNLVTHVHSVTSLNCSRHKGEQAKMLKKCDEAEPRNGELWVPVSKDPKLGESKLEKFCKTVINNILIPL
ncbi:hypothetical protein KIN20_000709 [Parelaphostrongylus tenuis]|uniref:Uncharacterized protein n=1 Tax=Parelaphostrongylus tenuis TaxID=148309 RepID=A0AAD5LV62_PARTN|nr:hypothetical protein KIN20_000709 [Parelaphostrongylus tenuis]